MKTQSIPVTEVTELQNKSNTNNESTSPRLWQSVLVGGVPGLLIGAGITAAIDAIAGGGQGPDGGPEIPEHPEINVAHSVNDSMSFSEAFEAARNEVGPGGAFVWHGNVYGTYRVDDPEWQAMSAEDRTEFSHNVLSQVHPAPYTPTANEPQIVEVTDEGSHAETPAESSGADDNVDVHIINGANGHEIGAVGQLVTADGTVVVAGYGSLDGHSATFIDSDYDGEVDTVLIDTDNDGSIDQAFSSEQVLPGEGMTVEGMVSELQDNMAAGMDNDPYGEMPDYTNDADMGTYV